jgi:hypothetical protein
MLGDHSQKAAEKREDIHQHQPKRTVLENPRGSIATRDFQLVHILADYHFFDMDRFTGSTNRHRPHSNKKGGFGAGDENRKVGHDFMRFVICLLRNA